MARCGGDTGGRAARAPRCRAGMRAGARPWITRVSVEGLADVGGPPSMPCLAPLHAARAPLPPRRRGCCTRSGRGSAAAACGRWVKTPGPLAASRQRARAPQHAPRAQSRLGRVLVVACTALGRASGCGLGAIAAAHATRAAHADDYAKQPARLLACCSPLVQAIQPSGPFPARLACCAHTPTPGGGGGGGRWAPVSLEWLVAEAG